MLVLGKSSSEFRQVSMFHRGISLVHYFSSGRERRTDLNYLIDGTRNKRGDISVERDKKMEMLD